MGYCQRNSKHQDRTTSRRYLGAVYASIAIQMIALLHLPAMWAQEQAPHIWIWAPDHQENQVPSVTCYFRKEFSFRNPEAARAEINADDSYELYINGRQVGNGTGAGKTYEHDLSKVILRGRNVVSMKVSNTQGSTAGLSVRLYVKERNGGWSLVSTDETWKTNLHPLPLWNTAFYNDGFWSTAKRIRGTAESPKANDPKLAGNKKNGGNAGAPTIPDAASQRIEDMLESSPDLEPTPTGSGVTKGTTKGKNATNAIVNSSKAPTNVAPVRDSKPKSQEDEGLVSQGRFKVGADFVVEEVVSAEKTGSLLAMTFNEFGHVIASRDSGPLLLIHDTDKDGIPDRVREYCTQVKGCQGILALNGEVYVTGDGPEGNGLYRLSDKDRDGKLETVKLLFKFKGFVGEHGAHGLTLGPDGWIYLVLGNHVSPDAEYSPKSPHRNWYEGDLVGPRYEDPGGHAVGIKAPGGVVIRTKVNGEEVECVAGGLRNAYDLAFNTSGDLFVHDSDMEADIGMTWYRPTQLYSIIPGGEYGWRSGWATWPEYYPDTLPPSAKTGRGSPTAAVVYDHFMFPKRYHDMLFLGDWSEGRILAVKLTKDGGSYSGESEVFLEGQPLNVTDMDVGPDGHLYFVTGGRGTTGGVYRVRWKGDVPPAVQDLGEGISAAIRQPQVQSAWGRQKVALIKQDMGEKWNSQIVGVARSTANPASYRVRALELMQLLGPVPSNEFLIKISSDKDPQVRAKVAEIMGLNPEEEFKDRLSELLGDADGMVRRKACEAIARADMQVRVDKIAELFESDDRFVATAARRLLEKHPVEDWRELVLTSKNHRVFIHGGLSLMSVQPEKQIAMEILERFQEILDDFISDPDFVDMLRLVQVALHRTGVASGDIEELRESLAEEFPSKHPLINRELIRVLAYLQADSGMERYIDHLRSKSPDMERIHLALHLRFFTNGWEEGERLKVIEYLEKVKNKPDTGSAFPLYIAYASRDIAKTCPPTEIQEILAHGAEWPGAALGGLYTLPRELDADTRSLLMDIDDKIMDRSEDSFMRLKVGIAAVLARTADAEAFAYLREIWDRDPERRVPVAIGLSQSPDGENWEYLVKSLPILDGPPAKEILNRLRQVDLRPEDPEHYRQLIIRGLTLKEAGANDAIALLEHWTGETIGGENDSWDVKLAGWQTWFTEHHPDRPEAVIPTIPQNSKWKMDDLLKHLSSAEAHRASPDRGAKVFTKAQCAKCHRFGGKGEMMGPDLTSVRKRFQRKEIVESVLFPSHVVSDQFASKSVTTTSGRIYVGIVTKNSDDETVVLTSTGEKVTLKNDDIDEITPSKVSAMPAGLLDPLSLEEISDLFAYLGVVTPSQNLAKQKGTMVK